MEALPGGGITTRAFCQNSASTDSAGASARLSVSPRSRSSRSSSREYVLVPFFTFFIQPPRSDNPAGRAAPCIGDQVVIIIDLAQRPKSLLTVAFAGVLFH